MLLRRHFVIEHDGALLSVVTRTVPEERFASAEPSTAATNARCEARAGTARIPTAAKA